MGDPCMTAVMTSASTLLGNHRDRMCVHRARLELDQARLLLHIVVN